MAVSAFFSDCGPIRSVNADAVLVDDAHGFYAIADGIGSTPASCEASKLAVANAHAVFLEQRSSGTPLDLVSVIDTAAALFRAHFDGRALVPGTTLTLVVTDGRLLHYASVGDSPLLLLQGGVSVLLTKHHTAVDQAEIITDFSALKSHNGSNVLVNTIGRFAPRPVGYPPIAFGAPCRALLATDGLFETLNQSDLGPLNAAAPSAAALVDALRARVGRVRAPDNYSVIIVDLEHEEDGHAERL